MGERERARDFTDRARALGAFHTEHLGAAAPYRSLARHADVSPSTVIDWLRGRRFPQDLGKFRAVVRALRAAALKTGAVCADPGLLDETEWADAHRTEATRRAGEVGEAVVRAQARALIAGGSAADRTAGSPTGSPATGSASTGSAELVPAPGHRAVPGCAPAPGARRVEEWNPRLLGVKPATGAPGSPGELPLYIPRDHDRELRRTLREMKGTGGVLLLVGEPSSGKSRSAHEAVRAELPGWWLLRPRDAAELEALALAGVRSGPGLVLWLDDLDRHLSGRPPLRAPALVRLLDPSAPVVVVGSLWPDQYDRHLNPDETDGRPPAGEPPARDVLALAVTVDVPGEFSDSERERALEMAERDPRIAAAMRVRDFGVVQTLAGAPLLERRWRSGNPYGRALVDAAIDARRLGAPELVTPGFLRAAAPGYVDSAHWARADDRWWETGLRYATETVDGTTAALSPRAGDAPGSVVGYALADHLTHVGSRVRSFEDVPGTTWRALLATLTGEDLVRVGWSAQWRLLYELADAFYAAAGPEGLLHRARLLRTRGRTEEYLAALEPLADAGREEALDELVSYLAWGGEALRGARIAVLARYADSYAPAARRLAQQLSAAGRHAEAIEVWARAAGRGDAQAVKDLTKALEGAGRAAEAVALLRERAGGDDDLRGTLVRMLLADDTARGAAEAERLLRARHAEDPDDHVCEHQLVGLFDSADRVAELEEIARNGSSIARQRLARRWAERPSSAPGDDAERAREFLRSWKPSPDGPWDELGFYHTLGLLDEALVVALEFERDRGGNDDLDTLIAEALLDVGRWEDLLGRADAGNRRAQSAVARNLAERGRFAELESRAVDGDLAAVHRFSDHLEQTGRVAEAVGLWRRVEAADRSEGRYWLIRILERHGRDTELLALLAELPRPLGKHNGRLLSHLLEKGGHFAELADLAASGDKYADVELVNRLAKGGRVRELCRRAVGGSGAATRILLQLATESPELRHLAEYGLRPDASVALPAPLRD
ncbi:hypothetical protein ACIA8H_25485 [Streptomyces goshikiensis]|uniref:hypothetical protein n=1 Tax=Streptomyces goshikiensis TaxID=1942 RepID=UPI0037B1B67A